MTAKQPIELYPLNGGTSCNVPKFVSRTKFSEPVSEVHPIKGKIIPNSSDWLRAHTNWDVYKVR